MRLRSTLLIATFLFAANAAASPIALAQSSAAAKSGKELAGKLCTSCHIVGEEAATATVKADVPSFLAIANKPGQTAEAVAGRIVLPHPVMPQVQLTRAEIADLAIYIMTLKKE